MAEILLESKLYKKGKRPLVWINWRESQALIRIMSNIPLFMLVISQNLRAYTKHYWFFSKWVFEITYRGEYLGCVISYPQPIGVIIFAPLYILRDLSWVSMKIGIQFRWYKFPCSRNVLRHFRALVWSSVQESTTGTRGLVLWFNKPKHRTIYETIFYQL